MTPRTPAIPTPLPSFVSKQVTQARRYFFDLDPTPGHEIRIVCGGYERARNDYVVNRSGFPFTTIEFVAEGNGTLELSGALHRLGPGMIFAYGPGIAHTMRADPVWPMVKYFVSFVGEAARPLLAGSALRLGGALQLSGFQEVREIFELLQREGAHDRRFGPRLCAALLPVLIIKIDEHALSSGTAEPQALETYQRAKRILEQRFMELRTAGEAAAACHVNSSYLCRLFRRFAHTTPYRFMVKLKMDRAAELLLDERMRVKEAAAVLGFADAFHFSHTFKRIHGISPERFVQRSRGTSESDVRG